MRLSIRFLGIEFAAIELTDHDEPLIDDGPYELFHGEADPD